MACSEVGTHVGRFRFLASSTIVALLVGGLAAVGSDSVAGASTADATVSSFKAAPLSLSSSGGQVKLTAQVTGATSCAFSSIPTIAGLPVSVACSNGKVKTTVTVPASVATVEETYTFKLSVTGASGPIVKATPVAVTVAAGGTPLAGIVSMTSDGGGSCAVLSTGAVDCWGDNPSGQLGDGTTGGPDVDGYDTAQAVTGLTDAFSVTSDGDNSYCAVLSTGAVDCWGLNGEGELGNGTVGGPDGYDGSSYDTPQAVTGLTDAVSLTSYGGLDESYCALLSTGAVDCWGDNGSGELGNGTTGGPGGAGGYDTPQTVTGITDAVSLTSDGDSSCAVLSTGAVDCWGGNRYGELGNGTTGGPDGEFGSDSPQAVTGLTDAVSLTSDNNRSYCAVLSTGAVDCWGYNYFGELGDGTTDGPDGARGFDTPQAVTGLTDAVSLTSDGRLDESYCAVLSTGAVNCWGDNGSGELGDGTTGGPDGNIGYDTPQAVTGLTEAVSASSDGSASYCALLSTGAVDCWGYNRDGELGNGTTGGPDGARGYDTPKAVSAG